MSPSNRVDAENDESRAESDAHRTGNDERGGAGDESRADSDSGAQAPPADILSDDGRPLGDTDEAHDELSPHDLPIGHPGRQAAEEQSGGKEGTTRGHQDPSEAGEDS